MVKQERKRVIYSMREGTTATKGCLAFNWICKLINASFSWQTYVKIVRLLNVGVHNIWLKGDLGWTLSSKVLHEHVARDTLTSQWHAEWITRQKLLALVILASDTHLRGFLLTQNANETKRFKETERYGQEFQVLINEFQAKLC